MKRYVLIFNYVKMPTVTVTKKPTYIIKIFIVIIICFWKGHFHYKIEEECVQQYSVFLLFSTKPVCEMNYWIKKNINPLE